MQGSCRNLGILDTGLGALDGELAQPLGDAGLGFGQTQAAGGQRVHRAKNIVGLIGMQFAHLDCQDAAARVGKICRFPFAAVRARL